MKRWLGVVLLIVITEFYSSIEAAYFKVSGTTTMQTCAQLFRTLGAAKFRLHQTSFSLGIESSGKLEGWGLFNAFFNHWLVPKTTVSIPKIEQTLINSENQNMDVSVRRDESGKYYFHFYGSWAIPNVIEQYREVFDQLQFKPLLPVQIDTDLEVEVDRLDNGDQLLPGARFKISEQGLIVFNEHHLKKARLIFAEAVKINESLLAEKGLSLSPDKLNIERLEVLPPGEFLVTEDGLRFEGQNGISHGTITVEFGLKALGFVSKLSHLVK